MNNYEIFVHCQKTCNHACLYSDFGLLSIYSLKHRLKLNQALLRLRNPLKLLIEYFWDKKMIYCIENIQLSGHYKFIPEILTKLINHA